MAPRSIFGERKKGKKAVNEAGSSRPDVTIVTEDESDVPPRSSAAACADPPAIVAPRFPPPLAVGSWEFQYSIYREGILQRGVRLMLWLKISSAGKDYTLTSRTTNLASTTPPVDSKQLSASFVRLAY